MRPAENLVQCVEVLLFPLSFSSLAHIGVVQMNHITCDVWHTLMQMQ